MALIGMAIFDTVENRRSDLTRRTLASLAKTVDFNHHRVFLVVNAATAETTDAIIDFCQTVGNAAEVIYCQENIGTARAINKAWEHRVPGENAIKMDNDVVVHRVGWVDEMEAAIARDQNIGIIGLKRKDLAERPDALEPQYRSVIRMLPHTEGQTWVIVEQVAHVMGTCQMFSSALLENIGYLCQPGLYGFDDSLASARSRLAGFVNCFLPCIPISHIDFGGDAYTQEKRDMAARDMAEYHRMKAGYQAGTLSIVYDVDGQPVPMGPATGPGYTWRIPNLSIR